MAPLFPLAVLALASFAPEGSCLKHAVLEARSVAPGGQHEAVAQKSNLLQQPYLLKADVKHVDSLISAKESELVGRQKDAESNESKFEQSGEVAVDGERKDIGGLSVVAVEKQNAGTKQVARAAAGGGTESAGVSPATQCPENEAEADIITCAPGGGTTAYKDASGLTYNGSTGKFTGSLAGSSCPPFGYYQPDGRNLTSSCSQVAFPASGHESGPTAAPMRGSVGYSLNLGSIFGPMEAGFGDGMPEACTEPDISDCQAGMDVPSCEDKVRYECENGGGTVQNDVFLDDCGGHASPYHYHSDPRCDYDQHDYSSHSPLLGIALDGHGIYGLWEGGGAQLLRGGGAQFPSLDACNGHTGAVPANSELGVAATSVYHYHTTTYKPYTVGCFGPVSSVSECKALYSSCDDGDAVAFTGKWINGSTYNVTGYDLDCPCFQQNTAGASARLSDLDPYYHELISTDPYENRTWTDPTAGGDDQASLVGDPHVANIAHERFEIRADGEHKLVQIPRFLNSSSVPDLRVGAVIQHLEAGSCDKAFMTSMSVSGRWTGDGPGLLRITRGSDTNTTLLVNAEEPAEFFRRARFQGAKVGPLYLNFELRGVGFHVGKHFEGRYGNQQSYLNVRITGLKKYYEDVGGLLGHDSHEEAEHPPANCTPARASAGAEGGSLIGKERSVPNTDGGSRIVAE